MKEIAKEHWFYILYQQDDDYFLSVLCGTSAMFEVVIKLTDAEIGRLKSGNVRDLAEDVRHNFKAYQSRKLVNFIRPS